METMSSISTDMKCSNCHRSNKSDFNFCSGCGQKLSRSQECCVCYEKTNDLTFCGDPVCISCLQKPLLENCPICRQKVSTPTSRTSFSAHLSGETETPSRQASTTVQTLSIMTEQLYMCSLYMVPVVFFVIPMIMSIRKKTNRQNKLLKQLNSCKYLYYYLINKKN